MVAQKRPFKQKLKVVVAVVAHKQYAAGNNYSYHSHDVLFYEPISVTKPDTKNTIKMSLQ